MLLEIDDLTFDYPLKRALSGVSLRIAAGTITAVVGPNGAGKTTLLRCVAGLEQPAAGMIRVDGVDSQAEPREVHRRVGFLQDFFGLYDNLTVARCLEYAARARGVASAERASRVAWAADMLDLTSRLGERASTLSRGLRQRLAIAQTIIHRPILLLLDEPAAGLDPEARVNLSSLIRKLRDEGHTLQVSSHILAELEDYSTDMLIVEDGRVIRHSTLADREGGPGRQRIEIQFSAPVDATALAAAGAALSQLDPTTAVADIASGDAARLELLRAILDANLPVLGFAVQNRDLSRFYLDNIAADREARARGKAS
jgi:ABC-2 type transport system ATP-binding protein